MNRTILPLALAAALLPTALYAQTTPAAPTVKGAHHAAQVQGKVTAVDTTAKTVTVSNRRSAASTTLTLAPDAVVYVTRPAALADIKTGDTISASGSATPEAPTLASKHITILPTAAVHTGKIGKRTGFHKNMVQGTVATTSPALTITTPGGITVTVTPDTAVKVTRLVPGTLSDVVVGANVQARTNGDTAAPTATELRVVPPHARAGGKRRKAANADVTPAATVALSK